jgi:hypothetical protein
MPKATYRWEGRIMTKITYEKRLTQEKNGKKRRKTATASRPSEEMVAHNAPTCSVFLERKSSIPENCAPDCKCDVISVYFSMK